MFQSDERNVKSDLYLCYEALEFRNKMYESVLDVKYKMRERKRKYFNLSVCAIPWKKHDDPGNVIVVLYCLGGKRRKANWCTLQVTH